MREVLGNLQKNPYQRALTGPLQRGDIHTVSSHIDALEKATLFETSHLYTELGKKTLKLTTHSSELLENLIQTLSKRH